MRLLCAVAALAGGPLGCGSADPVVEGPETATVEDSTRKSSDSGGVVREFDIVMDDSAVHRGVCAIDDEMLRIAVCPPDMPRELDPSTDDASARIIVLRRVPGARGEQGDGISIVGEWLVESMTPDDPLGEFDVGGTVEFTAEETLRFDGHDSAVDGRYRMGGVPQQRITPADRQATAIRVLRKSGADIELNDSGQATRLVALYVSINDEQFSRVADLPTLEQVSLLKVSNLTSTGFSNVSRLPALRRLSVRGDDVSDEWLAAVAEMKSLEALDFAGCRAVTDSGVRYLDGLSDLMELRLGDTQVGDAGIERIGRLSKLAVLDLKRTNVTDSGLIHLRALTRLTDLDLSGDCATDGSVRSGITDAGMDHLAGLGELRRLELNATHVTGAGLMRLAQLERLELLSIVFSREFDDDEGFMQVEPIERFLEALPRCTVRMPNDKPVTSISEVLSDPSR